MLKEKLLMTPGPTMVPPRVLAAESSVMIHHRTSEYEKLFSEVCSGLQYVFQTSNPVLTFPSAGTGGLEAAICNFFSPGDSVLAVSIGVFGDRFASIAKQFGLDVDKLSYKQGEAADPNEIASKVQEKKYKAVLITHNETSTGVTNDIASVSDALAASGVMLIVDAVSSMGALDLKTDDWGLDVVITASQKALMAAPGLAFVSVSEKALQEAEKATLPKYYWDILKAKKSMEKAQNPYTPAVSLLRGLSESLAMIREEGLENVFYRHSRLAEAVRQAAIALDLDFFAAEGFRSDCITSILMPEGLNGEKIKDIMDGLGVIIAGGQDDLKGKIIRIGHMGYVDENDIIVTIATLEQALKVSGMSIELGSGVAAVLKCFMNK